MSSNKIKGATLKTTFIYYKNKFEAKCGLNKFFVKYLIRTIENQIGCLDAISKIFQ